MKPDIPEPDDNRIDAILMCGEGRASHAVAGEKAKALLLLDGQPLFIHVLSALEKAVGIKRIFVVGPKSRLDDALSNRRGNFEKPVAVLEQKESLMTNAWAGFIATFDDYYPGLEKTDRKVHDKKALFVSGDAPLVTPAEIDEFIEAADGDSFDYIVGLSPAQSILPFAKAPGRPGIDMASFHLKEGLYRINNLHLARPFAFEDRGAVQKMYDARYQKSLVSFASLLIKLSKIKEVRKDLWLYILMQASLIFRRVGLIFASDAIRRYIPLKTIMDGVGKILGLRAGVAVTHRGGAAIDVDSDGDYESMKKMFGVWREMVEKYNPEIERNITRVAGEVADV